MIGSYISCNSEIDASKMSAIIMFMNKMLGSKPEGKRPLGSHGQRLKYKAKCILDKQVVNV
jgi:hypothetical protein